MSFAATPDPSDSPLSERTGLLRRDPGEEDAGTAYASDGETPVTAVFISCWHKLPYKLNAAGKGRQTGAGIHFIQRSKSVVKVLIAFNSLILLLFLYLSSHANTPTAGRDG